jgi:hypothetical protein
MAKMIKMKAQCQFPDNTILVLEEGMTLEVYREQEDKMPPLPPPKRIIKDGVKIFSDQENRARQREQERQKKEIGFEVYEIVIDDKLRREYYVICPPNTRSGDILKCEDIPKLNSNLRGDKDIYAYDVTVVSNDRLSGYDKAKVVVSYREQANEYTKAKDTCTDCGDGPCTMGSCKADPDQFDPEVRP